MIRSTVITTPAGDAMVYLESPLEVFYFIVMITEKLTVLLNNYDETKNEQWRSHLLDLEGHMCAQVLFSFVEDCVDRNKLPVGELYRKEMRNLIVDGLTRYNDFIQSVGREGHRDYTKDIAKFMDLA